MMILILLLLDTIFLTQLLSVTGGAMNPFVFLYLIHIVTGAIILEEQCAWLIVVATLAGYSLLFYSPLFTSTFASPVDVACCAGSEPAGNMAGSFQMHLKGMWFAFVVTAVFIVFFVSKIQKAFKAQSVMLQALGEERERNKRLTSLATFAAGAAHELSTPLSTVAVVSCEMIHAMENEGLDPVLVKDLRLIRKQVADCKEILYQMTAGAGGHLGEQVRTFSMEQVVDKILEELSPEDRKRVRVGIEQPGFMIFMPFRSLCRAVKGLIKNGLEASSDCDEVFVRWFVTAEYLGIEVCDQGSGIAEELESRVLEPSFTTKDSGLGLGLFLAKSMAEQFGGDLRMEPRAEQGMRVILRLARRCVESQGHKKREKKVLREEGNG